MSQKSKFVCYIVHRETGQRAPLEGRGSDESEAKQSALKQFKKRLGGKRRVADKAMDKYKLEVFEKSV